MSKEKRPLVGVGVLIENEKRELLLGLRHGSHGSGEWSFPGGYIEFGETIFETAKKEVKEETGLEIEPTALISVSDDMHYVESDGKHYITIGVRGKYINGVPEVKEPEKCKEWKWFHENSLPENLFGPTAQIINNYKAGTIYTP